MMVNLPVTANDFAGLVIVRTLGDMSAVLEMLLESAQAFGFLDRDLFGLRLSLEEAIVNSLKHGNRFDPSKKVRVEYRFESETVEVAIEDDGPGFRPDELPDPLAPENLEREGGRGLLLMRHFMSEVRYNERGNGLYLRKTRGGNGGNPPRHTNKGSPNALALQVSQ